MGKAQSKSSSITSIGPSEKLHKKHKKSRSEIIAEITVDLQELMGLWREMKSLILKAFLGKSITEEDESAFLELKSTLSRQSRSLDARVPPYLEVGASEIQKIIKTGVNLRVLSQLPTITKKGLYGKWHVASIHQHRTMGAMSFYTAGYRPKKKKAAVNPIVAMAQNLNEMFGHSASGDNEEKPVKKLIIIVIGVAAAAACIFFAMQQ